MKQFFISLFNFLVRGPDRTLAITISVAFFILAILCVYWSIRKKNDAHPIAWGWIVLCIISLAISVTYVVFGGF